MVLGVLAKLVKEVRSCEDCIFEDCHEYWNFCPYTSRRIEETKEDVQILADAEVIA